jgi:MYXO-CTERM domain-containing protein
MQRPIVFVFLLFAVLWMPSSALADGFVATLSAFIYEDVGDDGFGADDTIQYRLVVKYTGATEHTSFYVDMDVPAGSEVSGAETSNNYEAQHWVWDLQPGEYTVSGGFSPAPFASSDVAELRFRLKVTETATVSIRADIRYWDNNTEENVYQYSNTVVYTPGMRDGEVPVDVRGILGATLLHDANFYGTLETGESLSYAAVITNSGKKLTSLVIKGVVDPNTVLIPGTVNTTAGEVVTGNAEGDTEVEVFLDSFASSATAFISYAVTVPAEVTAGTRNITAKVLLQEEESSETLLELMHKMTFGPLVRLMAAFSDPDTPHYYHGDGANTDGIHSLVHQENIKISNDGPSVVTDVTISITTLDEPPANLASMVKKFMPESDGEECKDNFRYFCKADGSPVCEESWIPCAKKPKLESYAHPGTLAVGKSFDIKWKEKVPTLFGVHWMRYRVEITAKQVGEGGETFSVVHHLDRFVFMDEDGDDAALSPWVALAALGAAGAYAFRRRRQHG